MQVMINIPKEQYDMILLSDNTAMAECVSKEAMMYAIKNGTPLPKGHGRIGDLDKARTRVLNAGRDNFLIAMRLSKPAKLLTCEDMANIISKEPTIIEADKGE